MKNKFIKGFTLVEILVTMAIALSLMVVVLWNYSTFNDTISLSSAGQEMALNIRQTQSYGINVKEAGLSTGKFPGYGLYVNPTCDSTHYYIFADVNANLKFDNGGGAGGCGNPDSSSEFIEKVTIRNGVTIAGICSVSAGVTTCPPDAGTRSIEIIFLRPNPDAKINFLNNGDNYTLAQNQSIGKIKLQSIKGTNSYVTVENAGQITIQ